MARPSFELLSPLAPTGAAVVNVRVYTSRGTHLDVSRLIQYADDAALFASLCALAVKVDADEAAALAAVPAPPPIVLGMRFDATRAGVRTPLAPAETPPDVEGPPAGGG
jgi:hypothetical protein